MGESLRVIIVEDMEDDVKMLLHTLTHSGYDLDYTNVCTEEGFRHALEEKEWDLVLCDHSMPRFDSFRALKLLKSTGIDLPFIIVSGIISEKAAVEGMRAGAHDFVNKGNLIHLVPAIKRELTNASVRNAQRRAEKEMQRLVHNLNLRIKESKCLYDVANLVSSNELDVDTVLRMAVKRVCDAMQYPRITCGRIILDGVEYKTENFDETEWSVSTDLRLMGEPRGRFEVFYTKSSPGEGEGPFLAEEVELIGAVASHLGNFIFRRRMAEDRRKLGAMLETILTSSPVAIIVVDAQGNTTLWNPAAETLFGWRGKEVLGKPAPSLPPHLMESFMAHLELVGAGGAIINIETKALTKSGAELDANLSIGSIYDESGKFAGFVGVVMDLSERKRAEEELKASEEKFRLINEAAQDAVVMMNSAGLVTSWNGAAERMFGYTAAEAMGNKIEDLIVPPDMRGKHEAGMENYQRTGIGPLIGKLVEVPARKKDGAVFPCELALSSVKIRGELWALGIVRDITARKQSERMLLQSEKMASIGQLAAGIAHEINNPISYVNANNSYLRRDLEKIFSIVEKESRGEDPVADMSGELRKLKNECLEMLDESEDGTKRVIGIVKDLKTFTRISEEQWEVYDIHAILDGSLNIARNEIKYKAEVIKEYNAVSPHVECIPAQLGQVFLNILINAAQAMDGRGSITIRTGEEAENMFVEISDTGNGMPQETLNRVFEPFFTTKPQGVGTGLGLSIVYGIVQKHNGSITAQSEVGKGTTFRITLPFNRREQA
ncbi:MAG: PAS domain S-box protein [Nitrospinae bacterium]|nr:PAS domain S-box protein [Nitrospinota bacterium]